MSFEQNFAWGDAKGWHKFVASQFQKLAEWVAEVDRIHKATINLTRMFDTTRLQPFTHLCIDRARHVEGDVMQIANAFRVGCRVHLAVFARKDGDQNTITRVEIEMALLWHIQV